MRNEASHATVFGMSLIASTFYLIALFAILPHRTLAAVVLPYGPAEGDQASPHYHSMCHSAGL